MSRCIVQSYKEDDCVAKDARSPGLGILASAQLRIEPVVDAVIERA
jgi:hypothetical protein